MQKLSVNSERLKDTIDSFAAFGRTENHGVTRLSLTREDIRVRDYFCSCCKELGMKVIFDDMGSIYATLEGVENKPPVVIGSHLDSVTKGGRFDGVLGVIAGLEIARTLFDHQIKPRLPLTIINFTNEEGARFEPSMMASGVLSGKFDKASMLQKKDADGITFEEALFASGYLGDIDNRITEAAAYFELHIEQGPVLENEHLSIGVVDCVVGMVCYEIEVTGESNHAGTTPMNVRKDAFVAAMDLMLVLRGKLDGLDPELVYTMGRVHVHPNIHTVIPNKTIFTLEARHKNEAVIHEVEAVISSLPNRQKGCDIKKTKLWNRDTIWFNERICNLIEQSTQSLGYSYTKMASGAGHDAQFVAGFLPSAMIFVPSVEGKSHCEEEYTSYEDCENGVNVLLQSVMSINE